MGEFLSSPIKDKDYEDGENSYIKFGASGMQGWRKRMEDSYICALNIGNNNQYDIFGVFDGHNGKEVSQFVKNHFIEELEQNENFKNNKIKEALKETFIKMDELMKTPEGKNELKEISKLSLLEDEEINKKTCTNLNDNSEMISNILGIKKYEDDIPKMTGTTACVCVIDEKENKLYFANCGDSRAVLCKKNTAFPQSIDHKPDLPLEKNRIINAKGWISMGRVKGNLNISRSIGDFAYKQNSDDPNVQMVSPLPEINIEKLNNDCEFIVIGCDGIWDCLDNQEVCNFVKQNIISKNKLSEGINEMLDNFLANEIMNETGIGCDNMTCIVVELKKGFLN